MVAKFENVKLEEVKGSVSSKDASKYYGSIVLKFKNPDTKKNESFPINVNNPMLIQTLEQYEVNETLLNVSVQCENTKFGTKWGDIVQVDIVEVA